MNREKNLIKNTGIIAIGQLSSKFFTFLLLPLYTSALLPEDYGTVDVLQNVIYLILYFVTLQIQSAVFRYIIDDREDKKKIAEYISSGLALVILNLFISTSAICIASFIFSIEHLFLFIVCLWSEAIFLVFQNITRGKGHNAIYSLSSFVVTVTSLLINLVLILGFHIGAQSILIALAVSNFLGSLIFFLKEKLWQYISWHFFRFFGKFDFFLEGETLAIYFMAFFQKRKIDGNVALFHSVGA